MIGSSVDFFGGLLLSRVMLELLVDPVERLPLTQEGKELRARNGARYPVVQGIPVLLRPDAAPTQWVAQRSYELSRKPPDDPLFLDTIGEITPRAKAAIRGAGQDTLDPVIRHLIGPSCGRAYRGEDWTSAPIPRFPFTGSGLLLDVGCNWGRWSVAGARAGFTPIGVDPSLGAVLAAKRFCERAGIAARFVCGDARFLPFGGSSFAATFSYSVFQHFSDADMTTALAEIARVLADNGRSVIQMASSAGLASFAARAGRRFRPARGFEVRYRSPRELKRLFLATIGPTTIEPDCFFGLGLQGADAEGMNRTGRMLTAASELVKMLSPLNFLADSVYCRSHRSG